MIHARPFLRAYLYRDMPIARAYAAKTCLFRLVNIDLVCARVMGNMGYGLLPPVCDPHTRGGFKLKWHILYSLLRKIDVALS